MAIDGPRSQCIKSEFYDLLQSTNYHALVNTRDGDVHAARRRDWRPGFSQKALQQHEAKVLPHIDQLVKLIEADASICRPSNVRDYMYWFGFDAMGEFVFSKSFGMLENRDPGVIVTRLQNALSLLGPLAPTPWLLHVGLRMAPRISVIKDWYDTLDWCSSQMQSRLDASRSGKDSNSKDLAFYLLEDGGHGNLETWKHRNWNMKWLTGDSLLAIVAGRYVGASYLQFAFLSSVVAAAYLRLFSVIQQPLLSSACSPS